MVAFPQVGHSLVSFPSGTPDRRLHSRSRTRNTVHPHLEVLEDRTVPSGIVAGYRFPDSGKQLISFGQGLNSSAQALAQQPSDSKIVVAGWTQTAQGDHDFALVRLNVDGTLDTSFGTAGKVTIHFGDGNDEATGVAVQPDGAIVVGGFTQVGSADYNFAVARLTSNGTLDSTFGNGGKTTVAFDLGGGKDDRANALALAQDAAGNPTIVLAGYAQVTTTDFDFAAARLTGTGLPDPSFSNDGKATVAFNLGGGNDDRATALLPNVFGGFLILAGYTQVTATDFDFALTQLQSDGTVDPIFGTNSGKTTVSFNQGGNNDDRASGITFRTVSVPHFGTEIFLDVSGTVQVSPTDFDFGVVSLSRDGTTPGGFPTPEQTVIPINAVPGGVDQAKGIGVHYTMLAPELGTTGSSLVAGRAQVSATGSQFALTPVSTTTGDALIPIAPGTTAQEGANAVLVSGDLITLVGSSQPAGSPSSFAIVQGVATSPQPSLPGVFDPGTANWYLRSSNSAGSPDVGTFAYGVPGWIPVAGDWDGTSGAGVGVVAPDSSTWYLRNELTSGSPDAGSFQYGVPGWTPVTGDWDGDAKSSPGVYDPATATWYLRNSNSAGAPDIAPIQFGAPGWIPVVGDWNGDGVSTIGVVDPNTMTWYLRNSNSAGAADITPFQFGVPGWTPVTGDWISSGKSGFGVVDPNSETWYEIVSPTDGAANQFQYGLSGWKPVPASYSLPPPPMLFQHAADVGANDGSPLTTEQLQQTVQAALTRLADAGLDPTVVRSLASASYRVAPLPGSQLGLTDPTARQVTISATAAGHGWFVDPTPLGDEEFASGSSLVAKPGSAAAGKEDLLTTVLHEMGHLAGQEDGGQDNLMADILPVGVRRTQALDSIFAAGLDG